MSTRIKITPWKHFVLMESSDRFQSDQSPCERRFRLSPHGRSGLLIFQTRTAFLWRDSFKRGASRNTASFFFFFSVVNTSSGIRSARPERPTSFWELKSNQSDHFFSHSFTLTGQSDLSVSPRRGRSLALSPARRSCRASWTRALTPG